MNHRIYEVKRNKEHDSKAARNTCGYELFSFQVLRPVAAPNITIDRCTQAFRFLPVDS